MTARGRRLRRRRAPPARRRRRAPGSARSGLATARRRGSRRELGVGARRSAEPRATRLDIGPRRRRARRPRVARQRLGTAARARPAVGLVGGALSTAGAVRRGGACTAGHRLRVADAPARYRARPTPAARAACPCTGAIAGRRIVRSSPWGPRIAAGVYGFVFTRPDDDAGRGGGGVETRVAGRSRERPRRRAHARLRRVGRHRRRLDAGGGVARRIDHHARMRRGLLDRGRSARRRQARGLGFTLTRVVAAAGGATALSGDRRDEQPFEVELRERRQRREVLERRLVDDLHEACACRRAGGGCRSARPGSRSGDRRASRDRPRTST